MFASLLFCFNLNVLTTIVFASMSQDCCGRFFDTWVGHALVGHDISSVLVGDEFECQLKCVHTQPCKSFNVHFSSTQANKHVCELNSQTREMKPSDFKARKGSNYYGPVQVPCVDVSHEYTGKQSQHSNESNHNSCKNGATWMVKDGKHQCHCSRNFTGSSCEILAEEIGCFNDRNLDRKMGLIFTYQGKVPWKNLWKVVGDCSREAKKKKFYYFAIQFFGECRGFSANWTYDKYGASSNCYPSPRLGRRNTNFVYRNTEV